MTYKNHVISTHNEKISPSGGFRIPTRPDHNGVDLIDANYLASKQNVGILAYEDGIVKEVYINHPSIGYAVDIAHTFDKKNYVTRYMHMKANSLTVKKGDNVKKGQKIGVMGTTGDSTGIHLHFGVKENSTAYNNGEYVDPVPYLTGVKSMRVSTTTSTQTTIPTASTSAITLKKDDKVKVKSGSKWSDGKGIASWVFNADMYIVSVSTNNTVCISTSKNSAITGRININNLTKV